MIRPGYRADLVLLDQDLLHGPSRAVGRGARAGHRGGRGGYLPVDRVARDGRGWSGGPCIARLARLLHVRGTPRHRPHARSLVSCRDLRPATAPLAMLNGPGSRASLAIAHDDWPAGPGRDDGLSGRVRVDPLGPAHETAGAARLPGRTGPARLPRRPGSLRGRPRLLAQSQVRPGRATPSSAPSPSSPRPRSPTWPSATCPTRDGPASGTRSKRAKSRPSGWRHSRKPTASDDRPSSSTLWSTSSLWPS